MKKVKLIMLILSAFFVFGLQTASAQFVDSQTAGIRVADKINTLSIDMDNAKQAGQMANFYQASVKHDYYYALILALKHHLTVSEAIDQTRISDSNGFLANVDYVGMTTSPISKQFLVDLQQEAITLLKN